MGLTFLAEKGGLESRPVTATDTVVMGTKPLDEDEVVAHSGTNVIKVTKLIKISYMYIRSEADMYIRSEASDLIWIPAS